MTRSVSRASWVNWAGSAAVVAVIAVVGTAQAGQDQQRQGGMIQKGKSGVTEQAPPADARAGWDLAQGKKARSPAPASGAVAGIVVARPEDQTACASGTASACRTIESGLMTGGAWSFVDGGVMGLDDWETQTARGAAVSSVGTLAGSGGGAAAASYARSGSVAPSSPSVPSSSQDARGNHIPSAVIVHRALAACDGGDVQACSAFARSVRPATDAERTETRTYTAGR
ncbi:hypothetical protein [Brevundimonas sp.]